MELRLFGGLRAGASANDGAGVGADIDLGRPRQRLVLAILAIECGHVVAADRLVELLWPDDQDKKVASLQAYISNLRRVLGVGGDAEIVRQLPGYRLVMQRSEIDVLRFEDHVAAGVRHANRHDDAAALVEFESAVAMWTAAPLADFADEPVVMRARTRWHGLLGLALESIAHLHLGSGSAQAALNVIEARLPEFPGRERLRAAAALSLYQGGRQIEALRLIDETRQFLLDEFGLDMGDELATLEGRILRQDPTLLTVPNAAVATTMPHPAAAVSVPESTLVGRRAELATLRTALADAGATRGGVVTVTGPSGIGKSALVDQFTAEAGAAGCLVIRTRCPETVLPLPLWPIIQIESALRDAAVLVGDGSIIDAARGDAFLIAQRVVNALRSIDRIVVVSLDDVQFADADTLGVLAHVVAELRRTRVLMVISQHPLRPDAGIDTVAFASELSRLRVGEVAVGPLDQADVQAWLSDHCRHVVGEQLAADVRERTGGSPLFLRELIGLIGADIDGDAIERALTGLPPGVVVVVRRRLARLSGSAQRLLSAASVLGASSDIAIVADIVGVAADVALDDLSPAVDADFVSIDGALGVVSFRHSIIAQALAAEITASRRASMHAAAARSLARRRPDAADAALVAHHAVAGAIAGTSELAIDASRRAAGFSIARGAFVDAARHSMTVATMLERFRPHDVAGRLEATIAAASAYERADRMVEAQQAVIAALDLARGVAEPDVVERAVSVLTHASIYPNQPYGAVDATLIALLRECMEWLPPGSDRARATVLAALGTELFHSRDADERERVTAEALAIARSVDEAALLARVLHAQTFAMKSAATVDSRRAAAVELASLARGADLAPDVVLTAELQIALTDYALGDLVAAHRRLATCMAMLDRPVNQALRAQVGFFDALIEMIRGNYVDAEGRFAAATDLFRRGRPAEADAYDVGQRLTLGHDNGRLSEADLHPGAAAVVDAYGLVWRVYTAVILFDLGRRDEAVERIAHVREAWPIDPDDYTSTFLDVAAAIIAVEIADVRWAAEVMDRLLPFAGRWAGGGSAALVLGPVDLALARLCVVLERPLDAERWFASAADGDARMASPSWLARTLLHQGRFLLEGGSHVDGIACLDRAREIATRYDLAIVAEQIQRARPTREPG